MSERRGNSSIPALRSMRHADMQRFPLLFVLIAACRTTVSSAPPNISAAVATLARPVRAWELREYFLAISTVGGQD